MSEPIYSVESIYDKDKGKTVYCIVGLGLPYEPLLACTYTTFDNRNKAKAIISYLEKSYRLGRQSLAEEMVDIKNNIEELITNTE